MESKDWLLGLRRDGGVAGYAMRIAVICAAIADAVFGSLAWPALLAQTPTVDRPTQTLLYFAISVPPLILAGLALFAPGRIIRAFSFGYGLFYLAILLLSALYGPVGVALHGEAWVISVTTIPAVFAVIGIPRPATWAYIPALGLLSTLVAIRSSSTPDPVWEGVIAGLYDASFSSLFVGIAFVALVWTRRLDERIADETRAQSVQAAQDARSRERQRIDALTHDGVISTLLVAAQGTSTPADLVALASSTRARLAEMTVPPGAVKASDLFERLHADANTESDAIEWMADDAAVEIPTDVADALLGAALEAVRNAHRHAYVAPLGDASQRISVHCRVRDGEVTIEVSDDGQGFQPELVPLSRLGIRRSIAERMTLVGGSADVRSAPGAGTTVRLSWAGVR